MVRTLLKQAANVPAVAIGVLIGATMLSGVAVAAAPGLVTIADATGTNKAGVNGAGQLLTAEASPRNYVRVFKVLGPSCTPVYTVPAGKALVIRSVLFDLPGQTGPVAGIYRDCPNDPLAIGRVSSSTSQFLEIEPGIALPAGTLISGIGANNASVFIYGYLVPAALLSAGPGT